MDLAKEREVLRKMDLAKESEVIRKMDLAKEREVIRKWLVVHLEVITKTGKVTRYLKAGRASHETLIESIESLLTALAHLEQHSEWAAIAGKKIISGEITKTSEVVDEMSRYSWNLRMYAERSAAAGVLFKENAPWWPKVYLKACSRDWKRWVDPRLQLLKTTANKAVEAFNLHDIQGLEVPYVLPPQTSTGNDPEK